LPCHFEAAVSVGFSRLPAPRHADPLHGRPGTLSEYSIQRGVPSSDDQAGMRHDPYKVVKLPLDRRKIVEDVRMIHLQIVQYCGAAPVVNELRALVEERGVVLIGLDDEER